MKHLYTTLIVFVLFVFPLMTWMFMVKGGSHLKETVEGIRTPIDSLDNFTFVYKDGNIVDSISRVSLEGVVTIFFHEDSYPLLKENMIKLDAQMSKATHLQYVALYNGEEPQLSLDHTFENDFLFYKDITALSDKIEPNLMAIVDTEGILRSYYMEKNDDFILLIKHLSLLLPQVDRGK